MKKFIACMGVSLTSIGLTLAMPLAAHAAKGTKDCATIQSGAISDSSGNPLALGSDPYGYNYQSHMFNGPYENFSRPPVPVASSETHLIMKWSDSWIANRDCDGDGKLDRGLVNGVVGGSSKGWLTNNVRGTYVDEDGLTQHYTEFIKIVYTGPGSPLWGSYTIVQDVYNDTGTGDHGNQFKPMRPGFGLNGHWTQG